LTEKPQSNPLFYFAAFYFLSYKISAKKQDSLKDGMFAISSSSIQFPRESRIAHTPLTLTRTAHRLQNGETSTASAIPSHSQNLIRHTV